MRTSISEAEGQRLHFWCPGCDDVHGIQYGEGYWTWNGDLVNPTFSPSILVHSHLSLDGKGERYSTPQCHSFVTDGRIQFLEDSTHALAGQTVEIPEWPFP